MPWVRLDDNYPEHPKVIGLSDAAFRLHTIALFYSARLLTDGLLPRTWLTGGRGRAVPKVTAELVAAGVWCVEGHDYRIHDYLSYQPTREAVLAKRDRKAEAGRLGGLTRVANELARLADAQADASSTRLGPASSTQVKPPPLPSPPFPKTPSASPLVRRRNLNAAYEHPRFDVPQVWHDKRVDALHDGEFGMSEFYKHLDAHLEANPTEDTEPRFDWLTGHFNTWVRGRQKPSSSDVPDVEETKRRWLSTR